MNKIKILFFTFCISTLVINSCTTELYTIGRSTINTVTFSQLELERDDYEILRTVTATATLNVTMNMGVMEIREENNEFSLSISSSTKKLNSGVLKFGYLTNDIGRTSATVASGLLGKSTQVVTYIPQDPEEISRRLAKYRLINEAKALGADGIIEPVISSDIAAISKNKVIIKTTASAKVLVLKTDYSINEGTSNVYNNSSTITNVNDIQENITYNNQTIKETQPEKKVVTELKKKFNLPVVDDTKKKFEIGDTVYFYSNYEYQQIKGVVSEIVKNNKKYRIEYNRTSGTDDIECNIKNMVKGEKLTLINNINEIKIGDKVVFYKSGRQSLGEIVDIINNVAKIKYSDSYHVEYTTRKEAKYIIKIN
jgi:predicted RNA-binding protein with PUA-like domain/uncharacterized protein YbjQ (UPF0145 family)